MSNLQKFNSTLEEFDKEVGKLKALSDVYQKLQGLIVAYDEINRKFNENNDALYTIYESQKTQQEKITKSLADIDNSNNQYKSDLSKLIEEKTDQLRKENKEFYKDLASTIRIQLDDSKLQIKQLIESERNQIKQIFEIEFAKNTKELQQVIERETNKQTLLLISDQKVIKLSIWFFGTLTIILSAVAVFKLLY